jgi:hypothetical protein
MNLTSLLILELLEYGSTHLLYASAAADEGADLILLSNYALMEGI